MMQRKKANKRDVTGVFLLNKPLDLSSNQALQKVMRCYNASKGGHTGSLDPLATGLLPICLGEATKFSQYLLSADKKYDFTIELGKVTTTGDRAGDLIVEKSVEGVREDALLAVVAKMQGTISQVPPMFSALKHQGKPLYHFAREGKEIERQAREITVFSLTVEKIDWPFVELSVHCSKGTYVRSLAVDIGEALGCGAYVTRLHRTAVGSIEASQMSTLERLESLSSEETWDSRDALLHPIEGFLQEMPVQCLLEDSIGRIRNGQSIPVPPGLPQNIPLRVMSMSGEFVGIAELQKGLLNPKRLCRQMRRFA